MTFPRCQLALWGLLATFLHGACVGREIDGGLKSKARPFFCNASAGLARRAVVEVEGGWGEGGLSLDLSTGGKGMAHEPINESSAGS
jgi:hypothetical protein